MDREHTKLNSENKHQVCVLKHKTVDDAWIAEGAGTWGRVTDNPEEAMKLPREKWVEVLSETALDYYELVPV